MVTTATTSKKRKHYKRLPRIAGGALQELRKQHFAQHPLCKRCEAQHRYTLATVLDHIRAIAKGGQDVAANRQGLCVECHKQKTAEDFAFKERVAYGTDGYPK